ncbi:30S ribosomal subunit protein S7 [Candidatus Nasuia deltocephalinicola]|uniref:30S ribosomal protein S7 n=1 Tax=Candidatus Nasuia deltocephalincola TaxID=1160784 RepID=A0A975A411_9PROT|nr:30S ribosomal protein S7 [Candidatus Nasuia deltocephalinicola]BEH03953.1 30S ribosomal subunit protein S7 [Candidatus Nasuia deltocephalinicola]
MSKKLKRIDRKIFPDILYNNIDVEKFINIIMVSGKKTIARNIVYKAFNYIKIFYKKDPIKIFSLALDNSAPLIESVNFKKNFNFNYLEIRNYRRKSLSMRWIKKFSKLRKNNFMYLNLAKELISASMKRGESVKKRNSIHKIFSSKKNYKNV